MPQSRDSLSSKCNTGIIFWYVIKSMIQASKMSQWIKVPIHKPDGLHAISRSQVKSQLWNPPMTLEVETRWWTTSLPASEVGIPSTAAKAKETPDPQGGRCKKYFTLLKVFLWPSHLNCGIHVCTLKINKRKLRKKPKGQIENTHFPVNVNLDVYSSSRRNCLIFSCFRLFTCNWLSKGLK